MDEDILDALSDATNEAGYLKAGFLGFPKSGKTVTASLLALVVREHFKLPGPIAMLDTEGGSVYTRPMIRNVTGKDLLAKRARSFDQMMAWGEACLKANISVGIVDSITHPWRELCDTFLAMQNEERARRSWGIKERLSFEDWNVLKPRWAKWTDFYLNCPMHLIICGRAGWEYEMETNEKGKKELVKTGVKMKTEGEFGFEPSLLVEVERVEVPGKEPVQYARRATVVGDRFSLIDGASTLFHSFNSSDPDQLRKGMRAVSDFFLPHIAALTPGGDASVDTDSRSRFVFEGGEDAWVAEKKQRAILCEEIQGELVAKWPGQTADEKKAKTDLINEVLGTRSWTKVENTDSGKLRAALRTIREKLSPAEATS